MLPRSMAVVFALIFVALLGQTDVARAVGIGRTCAGLAGLGCDDGLWCEIEPGACKRADAAGRSYTRRYAAACRTGRFAPAAARPTGAIAYVSGPRRRRITTARAVRGLAAVSFAYCRKLDGASTSAAAICGLTAFGAISRGLAKAPPIIRPPRNTATIVAITTPSRRGGT